MSRYRLTPQALTDIFDIVNFIAEDHPAAAGKVEEAIFKACEFLAENPFAGRERKELTPLPVRFWVIQPYSNYLIVYRAEKKPLQVIRVLHAARDLPRVLR
jgi:plasmid stabilization system protein ParE